MLLASYRSAPSRPSLVDSARASIQEAQEVDLRSFPCAGIVAQLSRAFAAAGATATSPDLMAQMISFREAASLAAAWDSEVSHQRPFIVVCERPASTLFSEVQALRLLLQVGGGETKHGDLYCKLVSVEDAFLSGRIECLFATTPDWEALDIQASDVALAVLSGLHVRGVLVAPMPRAADGFPKALKQAYRARARDLETALDPIPVLITKGGRSPAFVHDSYEPQEQVNEDLDDGSRILRLTAPGLSRCSPRVGTWSADPAYVTTHVIIQIESVCARVPVGPTLRRCQATTVATEGDRIEVIFTADVAQWPRTLQMEGEA